MATRPKENEGGASEAWIRQRQYAVKMFPFLKRCEARWARMGNAENALTKEARRVK